MLLDRHGDAVLLVGSSHKVRGRLYTRVAVPHGYPKTGRLDKAQVVEIVADTHYLIERDVEDARELCERAALETSGWIASV